MCRSSQCTSPSCVCCLQRTVVMGGEPSVVSAPSAKGSAGTTAGGVRALSPAGTHLLTAGTGRACRRGLRATGGLWERCHSCLSPRTELLQVEVPRGRAGSAQRVPGLHPRQVAAAATQRAQGHWQARREHVLLCRLRAGKQRAAPSEPVPAPRGSAPWQMPGCGLVAVPRAHPSTCTPAGKAPMCQRQVTTGAQSSPEWEFFTLKVS